MLVGVRALDGRLVFMRVVQVVMAVGMGVGQGRVKVGMGMPFVKDEP
jgi:hypothetical protein